MINVKYYEQRAAYDADKPNMILPNVSYCEDTDEVLYTPKPHDYSHDYITFVAEEDGTFKFSNSVNYSIDNGATWVQLPSNTDTPTVSAGNKIIWKAILSSQAYVGVGRFSSSGKFTVEGNVMSLRHGDDFIGKTDLDKSFFTFYGLFSGCTGLTSAENFSLPATTLAVFAYNFMFSNCTSLTTAPVLPATTLTENCYQYMFSGCTSLTTAPVLPATTLASECYWGMFNGCTSLTTAPVLPATTLVSNCYQYMFAGCTSLTTALELPATTLASYCYQYMFSGCISLTTAPELPATTLTNGCYHGMFSGCTNLNNITCLATDISTSNCTTNWVNGVAASGTFIKADSMTGWTTGNNGIPTGWEVQDKNASQYLTFVAEEDGTFKFSGNSVNYSVDNGTTWTTLASNINTPTVQAGDKIMFKATLTPTSSNGIGTFSSSGSFTAQGNVMSLLYGDNFIGQTNLSGNDYAFYSLFSGCSGVTSAENISLPATTLASRCYSSMFYNCKKLTTAPSVLPATTLAESCYPSMFWGCSSLTTAPELPATTLAQGCYGSMFQGCTSLTIAPELPATTLARSCYYYMFYGCTNLNSITCLATDISVEFCTYYWVEGVARTGTFTKASSMIGWPKGESGIQWGWTVQDYQS